MSKRISPLQRWRASYHYLSGAIRDVKKSLRAGGEWGSFKVKASSRQTHLALLKHQAHALLAARPAAQAEAQALWAQGNHNRHNKGPRLAEG